MIKHATMNKNSLHNAQENAFFSENEKFLLEKNRNCEKLCTFVETSSNYSFNLLITPSIFLF